MSNRASDEFAVARRGSGSVVDGSFTERAAPDDRIGAPNAERWSGRTRLAVFVAAVLASWGIVVLAVYLPFKI